ncbi:MAG: hypothetical protein RXR06_11450 [Thermoproteus sp.]
MTAAVAATAIGLDRWIDDILNRLGPEGVREVLINAAQDKIAVSPCFWFGVTVAIGKKAKRMLKTSIPKCVVKEAVRRIALGVIDGSKPNWVSLDNVKLLIMRYAEKHGCEHEDDDEAAVASHARIIAGYVREWVRLLADGGAAGSLEHMTLSQNILYNYLSSLRYC